MTPQFVVLLEVEIALIAAALFAIAWGLMHPRQMITAPALIVKPTMIRIPADEVHYDISLPGTGSRIHHAQMNGYYFISQNDNVVTYKRDELFVPAGAW